LIYPSADTIEEKVGSRYSLVVLAAKRAKQIKEGAPVLIETASTNPLTIALEEIAAGKVTVGEAAPVAETPALEQEETTPSITGIAPELGEETGEVEGAVDEVAEATADVA
jgi:DNA-directed RNA polymerase subunit omega